jgi:hypothetical protein
MARYIDADKLIAEIEENINTYWNEGVGGYYLAEDALEHSVKTAPTADVVPKSEVARDIFEDLKKFCRPPMPECQPIYIIREIEMEELKSKYLGGNT